MIRRRFINKVGEVNELPYLTIEALEDGLTASLSANACQYSTDRVTWTDLDAGTPTPAINTGEKLYFKATGLTPTSNAGIGTFTVSKQFNLSGNCMSMLFGDEAEYNLDLTGYDYAFCELFCDCTTLKSVSSGFLPATTLASYCYFSMFYNCTGLTTAPVLPATTLASYCYRSMFNRCSSLTTAPKLPVTTLADGCYQYMFYICTSLTTAPVLPATTLTYGCYTGMFYECTGLTSAPKLPATTLAISCYQLMFYGCTGLTTASELPSTTLSSYCYNGMFSYCTSLTTAPELPATTLADYCYYKMFDNCTSLTTAPVLPATTLLNNCYNSMFLNCNNLNYIKAMFTTTPDSSYTGNWVSGVASTGTFVKNADATWDVTGVNGVPSGWTITTETEGVQMIEFTIDNTSYQAEEGMTWGEWVNSEYSQDKYVIKNEHVYSVILGVISSSSSSDNVVNIKDIIKPNVAYVLAFSGGS